MKSLRKLLLSILTAVALTFFVCHAAAEEKEKPVEYDSIIEPQVNIGVVQDVMVVRRNVAKGGQLDGLITEGELGEVEAQLQLGDAYYFGKGTMMNLEKAFFWYEKAAQQGHPKAQRALGAMYKLGKGTDKAPEKAAYWYKKAANQGYAMAQTNLGILYETGEGVAQNHETARLLYEKAAEQGYARGQTYLGRMYELGTGVTVNYPKALHWYLKAAEQGYTRGQTYLGRMYELGTGVAVNYPKALYWYLKAAEQGYARAQTNLGALYEAGLGVEQNYIQAVNWYRKAAQQDYARGQFYLGRMFEQGLGVEKDPVLASDWYSRAAALGYIKARKQLARMQLESGKIDEITIEAKQEAADQAQDEQLTVAPAEKEEKNAGQLDELMAKGEVAQELKSEAVNVDKPSPQTANRAVMGRQILTSNRLGEMEKPVEFDGIIEPFVIIDIGTPVEGIVQEVMVERSNVIKAGQLLLKLDSSVENALVNKARSRANNYGEIELQKEKLAFAERDHDRIDDLFTKKAISNQKKDEAYTEMTIAKQRLQKAEEERQLAELELKQSEALLAQRYVKSPISGIVVDRYISQGEFVDNQPLLRIAQIDPLRVEVIVPSHMFGKIKPGMKASVLPELQEFGNQTATVTIVDRVIDAASNSFAVRLEIPNPDYIIPSGLKCAVRFMPEFAPSMATMDVPEGIGD